MRREAGRGWGNFCWEGREGRPQVVRKPGSGGQGDEEAAPAPTHHGGGQGAGGGNAASASPSLAEEVSSQMRRVPGWEPS